MDFTAMDFIDYLKKSFHLDWTKIPWPSETVQIPQETRPKSMRKRRRVISRRKPLIGNWWVGVTQSTNPDT